MCTINPEEPAIMDYRTSAICMIRTEHRTLAALLHALKHLVREIRDRHMRPDFALLRSMVYYIDVYPERLHHPKEEIYLFAPLAARTHAADADLAILREEHENGARLIRDLGHALLCYEHDQEHGFAVFAASVESYAGFYARHMEREEKNILPLALESFLPEDWMTLEHAFAENHDPLHGDAREAHFHTLFSHIGNHAPPPIGVGPPAEAPL